MRTETGSTGPGKVGRRLELELELGNLRAQTGVLRKDGPGVYLTGLRMGSDVGGPHPAPGCEKPPSRTEPSAAGRAAGACQRQSPQVAPRVQRRGRGHEVVAPLLWPREHVLKKLGEDLDPRVRGPRIVLHQGPAPQRQRRVQVVLLRLVLLRGRREQGAGAIAEARSERSNAKVGLGGPHDAPTLRGGEVHTRGGEAALQVLRVAPAREMEDGIALKCEGLANFGQANVIK